MEKYIFTDISTKETFEVECYPFEMHNLQNTNKDFAEWSNGRIITIN